MPGILPMKVIKVGNSAQARIAQACDRCRSKKIRCDGFRPSCTQCSNVGFECKTSDKLSRRAFPRGYTESLEERVRTLESEIRELKDLLDAKDDKIDMLSKLHPSSASAPSRRPSSINSYSDEGAQENNAQHFRMHQNSSLHDASEHEPRFVGNSNSLALFDTLKVKALDSGRQCPDFDPTYLAPTTASKPAAPLSPPSGSACKGPPRLLSDQMVNIFFQEWAPLFPVLHRPSLLSIYEEYVTNPDNLNGTPGLIQLHLVFGIATVSNTTRISYDTSSIESHWLSILETNVKTNSVPNLQCLLLAQMYCIQTGDWARVLRYKELSAGMALFLGLNQSQKRFSLCILPCETRKKVFWSLYTLDCFISALLGTSKSLKDHDIHCEYPMDVDDEYVSEQGIQPVLPGEFTKLSNALSVFNGARIMSKVLTELYPSHAIYEVSLSTVSALEDELDAWSNSLPSHLKMQFTDEKPSTNVISSRCPLLSLTYHYIRTLIHRPAACFAPSDLSSASTVALAASSKHIIQIIQLLEERNLSFSFCLNKDELLVAAGAGVMLQSLNLTRESKLMKDSQKTVCIVLETLKRRKAPEYSEFRSITCPLVFLDGERRSPSTRGDSETSSLQAEEAYPITPQYATLNYSNEQVVDMDERRATLPALPTASLSSTPSASGLNKRFRAIAPSTASTHSSREISVTMSPQSSIASMQQQYAQGQHPASNTSASSSTVNLDFFRFPTDPTSDGAESAKTVGKREQPTSTDWEKMLSNLGSEQLSIANEVHDWSSLSTYILPQDEHGLHSQPLHKAHSFDLPRTQRGEGWTIATEHAHQTNGPPQLEPVKTNSLFSFSDESLTSGEEFSSLDWGTSSGEGDDAFRAMMSSLTPEEANAFGFSDEPAKIHAER